MTQADDKMPDVIHVMDTYSDNDLESFSVHGIPKKSAMTGKVLTSRYIRADLLEEVADLAEKIRDDADAVWTVNQAEELIEKLKPLREKR